MGKAPPPPSGKENPETHGNVKKRIGTTKSEGAEPCLISAFGVSDPDPVLSNLVADPDPLT